MFVLWRAWSWCVFPSITSCQVQQTFSLGSHLNKVYWCQTMAASEVINDPLYSVDTVLKAASITSELCSSNSGSKTKAKPCHETWTPVSVSLPILLHICFHYSLHYFKVFFVWRMVWNAPFPLYNLSCLPLGQSIYHGHQAAQLSAMDIIIFICPNTSPEQVPFSGESNSQHFLWAHEGPWVPQQKSLSLVQFLLWAEILILCPIITV